MGDVSFKYDDGELGDIEQRCVQVGDALYTEVHETLNPAVQACLDAWIGSDKEEYQGVMNQWTTLADGLHEHMRNAVAQTQGHINDNYHGNEMYLTSMWSQGL
jgi:uncharacterized protein YukE